MIGVIARPEEEPIAREFFELFKTPWEFYRERRRYDVVLSTRDLAGRLDALDADLVVLYSNDGAPGIGRSGNTRIARIGADLFGEVRRLLLGGQSTESAAVPTLDRHVASLRDLITGCGIPLVEIPPSPAGYAFTACLTHDVDHASIRKHGLDSTAIGFLYRATLGSVARLARGRLTLKKLMTNWGAAAKLPLVWAGLAEDIWSGFDRYLGIEDGRPSTFFVIPVSGVPGRTRNGPASPIRRSGYGAADVAGKLRALGARGSEIGLHGIDAWLDGDSGRKESRFLGEAIGMPVSGVRMHWLYRDARSPEALEDAGFAYDSTVGYNDTVGYRAGTGQVFRPLGASRLLELPMHVMDTALFYPAYLDLSEDDAWRRVTAILDNAGRDGGVVTLNWHDRSIAPERLWGDFYRRLLGEIGRRNAWFATASDAVAWFRRRRSAVFEDREADGRRRVRVTEAAGGRLPSLRLRIHTGAGASVDTPFTDGIDIPVSRGEPIYEA